MVLFAILTNASIGVLLLEKNPKLTGTIPDEFGNLFELNTFASFATNLNGSMPEEVCELVYSNLSSIKTSCSVECDCCSEFCA